MVSELLCTTQYAQKRERPREEGKELRTLRTQDTLDPGYFGTSFVDPNYPVCSMIKNAVCSHVAQDLSSC